MERNSRRSSVATWRMALLSWMILGLGAASSEQVFTVEKDFKDFNRLQFSHAFHFQVRQGEEYRTVIRVSEQARKRLLAVQKGTTVSIGLTPGARIRLGKPVLRAEVVLPDLVSLELSGACQGTMTGFTSDAERTIQMDGASGLGGDVKGADLYFGISDASVLAMGCTTRRVQIRLSGASQCALKGIGGDLTVEASGASRADLARLKANDVKVVLRGASQAGVRVNGRLDIHASGASFLRYKGEAVLGHVEISGASRVSGSGAQPREAAGPH